MSPIVRAISGILLALLVLLPAAADARSARARIARVTAAVGTMQDVRVNLEWPAGATQGALRLRARSVDAPGLGHRFDAVDWRCTLRRRDWQTWRCTGPVTQASGGAMLLDVDIDARGVGMTLERGPSRIEVTRRGEPSEVTQVDLTAIPLAWMRTLLARAWPEAQLTSGSGDARLRVGAAGTGLRIAGPVDLRGVGFDTPDGTVAAERLALKFDLDMTLGATDRVSVTGSAGGGELLFGTTYVALGQRRAGFSVDAVQAGNCCWRIPRFSWRDPPALTASGSASFGPGGALASVDARVHSGDLSSARGVYLSGWFGKAGLADLEVRGGLDAQVSAGEAGLESVSLTFHDATVRDPKDRFAFERLRGDVRFSAGAQVSSELAWASGRIYGIDFDAARVPLMSGDGTLELTDAVEVPLLGGRLGFDSLSIRPPSRDRSAEAEFTLDVQGLELARLAQTFGLPAFGGQLSGRIPGARYQGNRLEFDGGLGLEIFGGRIDVSSLSMERPFGVAPTVSANVALDDLDLETLTGTLGFGSITGKLDGRIDALRLVDWQPVAFDARLGTDRKAGVRQRISQRAVQDLSSVGDASIVSSLQNRLIGLFDDFPYSRIGISCRLADQVCEMDGLRPSGTGFVIVQGGGIPWLTVVGFNRRVDWATLVERLVAVGKGDTKPVVD